jgi:hypothetical protein
MRLQATGHISVIGASLCIAVCNVRKLFSDTSSATPEYQYASGCVPGTSGAPEGGNDTNSSQGKYLKKRPLTLSRPNSHYHVPKRPKCEHSRRKWVPQEPPGILHHPGDMWGACGRAYWSVMGGERRCEQTNIL